jgi:hypothetical protein
MNTKKITGYLFSLLILMFWITACQNNPEEIYGIGDEVDNGFDQIMILNDVEFTGDFLEATFIIKNIGTEASSYNLVLSLQARDSEENPLPQLIPCGASQDGTIHPGKQATGSICWDTDDTDLIRIHYMVMSVDTKKIWEVRK